MSSHSSVDRVPAWCSGGHGFNSSWEFRFFSLSHTCVLLKCSLFTWIIFISPFCNSVWHSIRLLIVQWPVSFSRSWNCRSCLSMHQPGIIYLTLKQHLTPSLYRITDWDRIMCFSDFMYDRIMYVLVTSYLTELCVLEPS